MNVRRVLLPVAALATLAGPAAVGGQDRARAPVPEVGRTVVLEPARPGVRYRQPGQRFYRKLTVPIAVPLGTLIDAEPGRVTVVADRGRGLRWRATFWGGTFSVAQDDDRPVTTTLRLRGGSFRDTCEKGAAARTSARKRSKRRVRRLWGDGKGRFRTRGRWSAATVRGTRWLTEDRCDGTLTRVQRGEVEVEDLTVAVEPAPTPTPAPDTDGGAEGAPPAAAPMRGSAPRRVRVRSGDSYLAPAPE
jgi:hypothetical protein